MGALEGVKKMTGRQFRIVQTPKMTLSMSSSHVTNLGWLAKQLGLEGPLNLCMNDGYFQLAVKYRVRIPTIA